MGKQTIEGPPVISSERRYRIWIGKETGKPECPYCHSTAVVCIETRQGKRFTCDRGHQNSFTNRNLITREEA